MFNNNKKLSNKKNITSINLNISIKLKKVIAELSIIVFIIINIINLIFQPIIVITPIIEPLIKLIIFIYQKYDLFININT